MDGSLTRRARTTLQRAKIFEAAGGMCHICECKIDGTREQWDLEHVIPLEISGDDTDDNLRPAHVKCHRTKTKTDARDIAKCRRIAAKHKGAKAQKKKIPYRRFNGDPVWK